MQTAAARARCLLATPMEKYDHGHAKGHPLDNALRQQSDPSQDSRAHFSETVATRGIFVIVSHSLANIFVTINRCIY